MPGSQQLPPPPSSAGATLSGTPIASTHVVPGSLFYTKSLVGHIVQVPGGATQPPPAKGDAREEEVPWHTMRTSTQQ